ncbi:MAG: hypothetical protein FWE16_02180 [Firmicutes bacterium]|nr:hypothetical protein [Bacillota bacterium]
MRRGRMKFPHPLPYEFQLAGLASFIGDDENSLDLAAEYDIVEMCEGLGQQSLCLCQFQFVNRYLRIWWFWT